MRMRHIIMWPALLYSRFLYYLIKCAILEKRLLNTKYEFWLSHTLVRNISHSKRKWGNHLSDFNETWNFLDGFSNETSNVKFHVNPCSKSQVVPCARTDRHDEANIRSSQFCGKRILATSKHPFSCGIVERYHEGLQAFTWGVWRRHLLNMFYVWIALEVFRQDKKMWKKTKDLADQ